MAAKIDYDALRKQTLGTGNDEAVTVNTRALIDKVLARYSGEWTTLRELLQNAADASAKRVKITFESLPSPTVPAPQSSDPSVRLRHVLSHHTLKSVMVENNGDVFKASDWTRLKKIAEGNPDETKIGAFGVGFYSVFSDCEEPFVSSGNEALAFYWKGDALFTKSRQLPNGQSSDTTFMLPMRNHTSPVPNLLSLCRFLASSLTFVGLEAVELWLDEWHLMTLKKTTAPSTEVHIPKEVDKKTREGLMHVTSVTKEAAQIDAHWLKAVEWTKPASHNSTESGTGSTVKGQTTQTLRSFFHRLAPNSLNSAAVEKQAKEEKEAQFQISEDLLGECRATLFIHVNKAIVKTTPSDKFSKELERATKKPPPKTTTVSLLSASYDEATASSPSSDSVGPKIFDSFVPANGKGRIFIGFTTNQTTGLDIHISTPSIIPTVERESIDLNNRFVRVWNVELLRTAGIVARVSWGGEMASVDEKISRNLKMAGRTTIIKEDIHAILPEALFMHSTYNWSETTPSAEVGALIEEAFWTCNQKIAIATLSTRGVLPSSQVRIQTKELGFVDSIPVLPEALKGVGLIKKLIDYGVITEITITDIKSELESKALNLQQLRHFLEWTLHRIRASEFDKATALSLVGVAVANDEESGRLLVLGEMKNFLNASRIPADMPVPPSTLPFSLTKGIDKIDLELLFEDLQMVPWLRWLIENVGGKRQLSEEQDICHSSSFASAVLPVISKQYDGLSASSRATIIELLVSRTIMPTKMGMKKPSESYFPSVKLFDDLPVVTGLHSVKDKFLVALGVRKTIEIGVVFERLMNTSPDPTTQIPDSAPKWSHVDLIKYLASVQADVPASDIKRLKTTKMCPAETDSRQPTNARYLVSELFQPDQALRQLKVPMLYWPGIYRPENMEGKFLTSLGLRPYPSYQDLVDIISMAATTQDFKLREHALKYFIDHHQTKGYAQFDHSSVKTQYVPIQGAEKRVATPNNVFVNERAAIMGFDILRRDLHVHALKFGVQQDPPIKECINRLIKNPPQTKRNAREVFGYFAGRLSELNKQHTELLGDAPIIPTLSRTLDREPSKNEDARSIRHVPPRVCFLGYGDSQYAEIFDYVDFGQEANSFLARIGSKHEPSTIELAGQLVGEPARIFSVLGDMRYFDLLRSIANSWDNLRKDRSLVKEMRSSKCLLAYKEISSKAKNNEEDEEDPGVKTWELASASQVVIVDDMITYSLFKSSLLAAPMEDALESFYNSLGAQTLGSLLEERQKIGNPVRDQTSALKLQKLLHERTRLFLHDCERSSVKHNTSWVQRNLTVECIQSISLRKSLKGYNVHTTQSKSAVVFNDKPILYITAKYDMFEVSQALVPVLLYRSKPQSVFMLEMMLESSLHKLRSRGYPVQRILNEKQKEAQLAEEARKKQLEEEQQQLKEREAAWKQAQTDNSAHQQDQMPGVFPGSPDRRPNETKEPYEIDHNEPARGPRGFLSGLSKQFGFDSVRRSLSQNHLPKPTQRAIEPPHEEKPPPYSAEDGQRPTPQPEQATAPHHLHENLIRAVQVSRPHNSTNVTTRPAVNNVKETSTYCDSTPGHDLTYIAEVADIRVFLSRPVVDSGLDRNKFVANNASTLKLFASVLLDCADCFSLNRHSLHLFYDDSGSTIAFNSRKALFFNYRYFENLHLPLVQEGKQSDALVYWSVVMAHELAHNLVSDHSAQHSYYTESLIVQYFPRIINKLAQYMPPSSATPQSLPPDPLRPQEQPSQLDLTTK